MPIRRTAALVHLSSLQSAAGGVVFAKSALCMSPVSRLGYASQKEGVGDRSMRRANKIRIRLGWPAGILSHAGGKPKGMHWKTFWRLKGEHDTLAQVSFNDTARKLGFLHKLRGG
jgi:hypothetical protein